MRHNFFFENPVFKRHTSATVRKIQKRFLRHSGCLLKQGGQKLFIVSYATQLFFSKTQCSSDTLVRQSEKSKKRFLRHSGRLLKQKGSQNCFICLMVQNWMQYYKPLFMMLSTLDLWYRKFDPHFMIICYLYLENRVKNKFYYLHMTKKWFINPL